MREKITEIQESVNYCNALIAVLEDIGFDYDEQRTGRAATRYAGTIAELLEKEFAKIDSTIEEMALAV